MKIKIKSLWGKFSDNYVRELPSNNNGNYPQPTGGAVFTVGDSEVVVLVSDTSCGDFGSRLMVFVYDGCHMWEICFGSLEQDVEEEEYLYGAIASISGCLGINAWALVHEAIEATWEAAEMTLNYEEFSGEMCDGFEAVWVTAEKLIGGKEYDV